MQEHFGKLKENKHPNPKLQAAWNYYGEKSFRVEKQLYNITKEELDLKEIEEIKKENSYINGYNLTLGGTGGEIRNKINFQDFCEIYFGNINHEGLANRTAKVYGCDSSSVSSIRRKKSYDTFRELAENLEEEVKEQYYQNFIEKLNLKEEPPKPQRGKLSDEEIVIFLSLLSVYGRGIEAAFLRKNNLSKGLGYHLKKGEYPNAWIIFKEKSDEEIIKIADEYFEKNLLQNYCTQKIKRKSIIQRPSQIAH